MANINQNPIPMLLQNNKFKVSAGIKLLLVLLVFPMPILAADKVVSLQGHYEYNVYLGNQTPVHTAMRNFIVKFDGCSWIISYTNVSATAKDADDLMTVASCDGTNLYSVDYPSGLAEVWTGSFPYGRDVHLRNIWFAFGARCVLKDSKGVTKPLSCEDIGIYTQNGYTCLYRWVSKSDGAIDGVTLIEDGTYWARDPMTGQIIHKQYQPPYSDGFTQAVGKWVSVTNVAGFQFPVDFQFTAFGAKANGSSATDLLKLAGFRCVVTNITVEDMPPVPTKLPVRALVYDRRFVDAGYAYVTYYITNGIWPSINNSSIQQSLVFAPKFSFNDEALSELGIRQIGKKISPVQSHSRQEMTKWIILFTFIFPAIYFFVHTLWAKKQTKKTPST